MRQCLHCADRLLGRADKKFCSDGCRSAYHNENRIGNRKPQYQLMLNRQLLRFVRSSISSSQPAIALDPMKSLGFNPEVCTSKRNHNGLTYLYCYEMAYKVEGNQLILID